MKTSSWIRILKKRNEKARNSKHVLFIIFIYSKEFVMLQRQTQWKNSNLIVNLMSISSFFSYFPFLPIFHIFQFLYFICLSDTILNASTDTHVLTSCIFRGAKFIYERIIMYIRIWCFYANGSYLNNNMNLHCRQWKNTRMNLLQTFKYFGVQFSSKKPATKSNAMYCMYIMLYSVKGRNFMNKIIFYLVL